MPIGSAKVGTLADATAGGPVTPGLPAGTAAGELALTLIAARADPTSISTPSGWTQRGTAISGVDVRAAVYSRALVAGDAAPAYTSSGGTQNGMFGVMITWPGVDPGTPIDVTVQVATGDSATMTAPSATTASDGALVVQLWAASDDLGLSSPTNGATLLAGGAGYVSGTDGDAALAVTSKSIATGGTASGATSVTQAGGAARSTYVAFTVVLRPAAAWVPPLRRARRPLVGLVRRRPTRLVPAAGILLFPPGIPSAEAVGVGSVSPGPVSLFPPGVPSDEAVGTGLVVHGIPLFPPGIPSDEAVGTGSVQPGPVSLFPPGIPSAEAVGTPSAIFITLDPSTALRGTLARTVVTYELVAVARLPQQSGPPTFFEVDALEWSALSWSTTLSKPQGIVARCPAGSLTEPVKQRLRPGNRLPTELWLRRNGALVAAGPRLSVRRVGSDVEIVAGGLLSYLDGMVLTSDLRFAQVDQFTIAAALVNHHQGLDFGHVGIDTSAVGVSGTVRDRTYLRAEGHIVGKRLEELGQVQGGFDAEVDPTSRRLQLWSPTKGSDRSSGPDAVVIDDRNVTNVDVAVSFGPGDFASEALGTGTASGVDTPLWSAQANLELRAAYGRFAVLGSWSDVSTQATLDDHTRALLDARDQPLVVPGPKARVTVDADLAAYDVGDTIAADLDPLLGVSGAFRIRKRTVTVETSGQETVDLEFV